MTEANKESLFPVLYSMIYITTDLYSENLFSDDFCKGFHAQFSEKSHNNIRIALEEAMQNPEFPYEELLPLLKENYTRKDIYFYLKEFYKRLKDCL